MSSDVKIPDEVLREAADLVMRACPSVSATENTDRIVALSEAILSAEQRGLEKAAEVVAAMLPNLPPDGPDGPIQESEYMALGHALAAIRSLGENT